MHNVRVNQIPEFKFGTPMVPLVSYYRYYRDYTYLSSTVRSKTRLKCKSCACKKSWNFFELKVEKMWENVEKKSEKNVEKKIVEKK
jgi:hypothetical protein